MPDKKYVIVITPDGIVMTVSWNSENEFSKLQEYVGGYIEVAPTELSSFCMVVNKEGKLLNLPLNGVASHILPKAMQKFDCVCGNAVLMKRGREDLEPLTRAEVIRWKQIINEVCDVQDRKNPLEES